MSYQVLARKWRPKSFDTLVGQEHVVRALSHALDTGRLHHAWLFTGTRGVGKTTISRILAKALNCETGVSSRPCGVCSACVAIDADRFADYVEMDAASNRGVDDMAALLDQAVYTPVQGRYKVYMIDEVHMLTGHAFNAMLKTLEEPPAHVKFILATTDPQKIPVTVLSRCLQFNLKQMPPGQIVDYLAGVLEAEQIAFEPAALRHIARAAQGSMRDALSLLDQAIAHGAGKVDTAQVTQMLGTVGDDHLYAVLDGVRDGDVTRLLAVADDMEARSLSFDAALQTLASLFHRIALMQFAPAAVTDQAEHDRLAPYASAFDTDFLQLAYQIAIHGRDELPLAPDDYAGFTMCLLRLVAFRPEQAPALGSAPQSPPEGRGRMRPIPARAMPASAGDFSCSAPAAQPRVDAQRTDAVESERSNPERPAQASRTDSRVTPESVDVVVPPWMELPPEALEGEAVPAPESNRRLSEGEGVSARVQVEQVDGAAQAALIAQDEALCSGDWHAILSSLGLTGMLRELAQHCEWSGFADGVLSLRLAPAHQHLLSMNPTLVERLEARVAERRPTCRRIRIEVGEIAGTTPAQKDAAEKLARHAEAVAALERDPFVREIIERFDATLIEASVKPH